LILIDPSVWIDSFATFCILNNHALLHGDRDYDPLERWLDLAIAK